MRPIKYPRQHHLAGRILPIMFCDDHNPCGPLAVGEQEFKRQLSMIWDSHTGLNRRRSAPLD